METLGIFCFFNFLFVYLQKKLMDKETYVGERKRLKEELRCLEKDYMDGFGFKCGDVVKVKDNVGIITERVILCDEPRYKINQLAKDGKSIGRKVLGYAFHPDEIHKI